MEARQDRDTCGSQTGFYLATTVLGLASKYLLTRHCEGSICEAS